MRTRHPMCIVDKGDIAGLSDTKMWCLDSRVPYLKDGEKKTGWLRSFTWTRVEYFQGNQERFDMAIKGKKMLEVLPWESNV